MNSELALSFVAALYQAVEERKKLQALEHEMNDIHKLDPHLKETAYYKKQIGMMSLQHGATLRRTQQLDKHIEQLQALLGPQVKGEMTVEYNGQVYIIGADGESGTAFCIKHKGPDRKGQNG